MEDKKPQPRYLHDTETRNSLVKQLFSRLRQAAGPIVMAGAIAVASVQALPGCNEADSPPAGSEVTVSVPIPGDDSKSDWAEYEGVRDTTMVTYGGSSWHEHFNCNTRGGCMGLDVFVKVLVKPVASASLERKRVGIVYRDYYDPEGATALGSYFTTLDNGLEEWHVKVTFNYNRPDTLLFNAWYQDGMGNTYYDDNNGEYHVYDMGNNYAILRHDWNNTTVKISESGVHGTLSFYVADLDYDKDIRLIWSVDDWETVNEFRIGEGMNAWHWMQDLWAGTELWQMDVDIPGPLGADAQFEYAVLYRHGVVNNAKVYEFWDNNYGRNHIVRQGDHGP